MNLVEFRQLLKNCFKSTLKIRFFIDINQMCITPLIV